MSEPTPIDLVLHCPHCGMQHIDQPESLSAYRARAQLAQPLDYVSESASDAPQTRWANPPHRSHLCRSEDGGCGHIWRPADVPTNGVAAISTTGKHDSPVVPKALVATADAPDGFEIGFEWGRTLMTAHVYDGRDVARTLTMRCFDGLDIDMSAIEPFEPAGQAICTAKDAIRRALGTPKETRRPDLAMIEEIARWLLDRPGDHPPPVYTCVEKGQRLLHALGVGDDPI